MMTSGVTVIAGDAWSFKDQTKSVAVWTVLWQFMQPVLISPWSNVSRVALAKAVASFGDEPGKVFSGVPGVDGLFGWTGHCVITSW